MTLIDRVAMSLHLELSHGRPGASAHVELHERASGRVAVLALRGWIDAVAVRRLELAIDDLAVRGVTQLLLDCAEVRHIDYRLVPVLVRALGRFESHAGACAVCGLSHYLRDLFRLAGCEARLRCWPSAEELLGAIPPSEPGRERAS
jgi:anti-sigma B factor antagonist